MCKNKNIWKIKKLSFKRQVNGGGMLYSIIENAL